MSGTGRLSRPVRIGRVGVAWCEADVINAGRDMVDDVHGGRGQLLLKQLRCASSLQSVCKAAELVQDGVVLVNVAWAITSDEGTSCGVYGCVWRAFVVDCSMVI